jgi:hypothetical protein
MTLPVSANWRVRLTVAGIALRRRIHVDGANSNISYPACCTEAHEGKQQ